MDVNLPTDLDGAKIKLCAVCNKNADKSCSGCGLVSYCSIDHQKDDWKTHKLTCSPFIVKNAPEEVTSGGKVCVASRDLKAGTIILKELPVFHLPRECDDCCMVCSGWLESNCFGLRSSGSKRITSFRCPKCNWPLCGEKCSKAGIHADNECKVIVANKNYCQYPLDQKGGSSKEKEALTVATICRTYAIMNQQKSKWKKLVEISQWSSEDKTLAFLLQGENFPFFPSFPPNNEVLMALAASVHNLRRTHGFEIHLNTRKDVQAGGDRAREVCMATTTYIYSKVNNFTHSCAPNCDWIAGKFPDFKLVLRTSVPVKKGEILTVARSGLKGHIHMGTRLRQNAFKERFKTTCKCQLCMDPTEFGTYQSGVVCQSCKKPDANSNKKNRNTGNEDPSPDLGYLLPVDPLDMRNNAMWKCNKCHKVQPASSFIHQVDKIHDEFLTHLEGAFCGPIKSSVTSTGRFFEDMIKKYSNKLLHPNHWLLQVSVDKFCLSIVPMLEAMKHPMTEDDWLKFEKYSMFLLRNLDKKMCGLQYGRVIHLPLICKTMAFRFDNYSRRELGTKSLEELEQLRKEVLVAQQFQKEWSEFVKDGFVLDCGINRDAALYREKFKSTMHILSKYLGTVDEAITQGGLKNLSI